MSSRRSRGVAGVRMMAVMAALIGAMAALVQAQPQPAAPPLVQPAAAPAPAPRVIAIFVKNHAGKPFDEKVDAMQDLVATRIGDLGLSVISREDAANAVAKFASQGANAGKADAPGADLDALLSNQTSALRLATNLGADYIFTVAFSTYGQSTRAFSGSGIETTIIESKLRVSYKLLDKFVGGTITGDTVTATSMTRATKGAAESTDIINDLLDDAAQQLAASLKKKLESGVREPVGDPSMASLTVSCGVQGMTLPDVVRNQAGEYVVASHQVTFEPSSTVELNGVVIGTAPGTFRVPKGLSKLRVSRDGCAAWERTISITGDQKLSVDLTMTDAAFARWREATAFLASLKAGEKITDAQAKVLEGEAKRLRQSGYRVDIRQRGSVDIKVDTKEGVKIQNQARDVSIFQ